MPNVRPTRQNSVNTESLSIDEKLNILLTDVGQIKSDNKQCLSDISEIKNDMIVFKEEITKTIDLCYSKMEDCNKVVKSNSLAIKQCEEHFDEIKSENIALKKRISELGKKLSAAEQYSRSNCLEISGVPEEKNENLFAVIRRVASVLNFDLQATMVDSFHRLAKNKNKPDDPRGIIVKFCRRLDLEEMRRRARVKRSLSASELGFNSERTIYINLSLTRETRQLWAEVRNFKARHNYKYAWITGAGKIFLRKEQGDPAVQVSEMFDLDSLK